MPTRKRLSVVFSGSESFPSVDGVPQPHHDELGEVSVIALSQDATKTAGFTFLTSSFS